MLGKTPEFSGDGEEEIAVLIGLDESLAQERFKMGSGPAWVSAVFFAVDAATDLLGGVEDSGGLMQHLIDGLFHWKEGGRGVRA
jgi:hypothetical protein